MCACHIWPTSFYVCRTSCLEQSATDAAQIGLLIPSKNKTAELSQRRPRDAPNIWVPWKVSRVLTTHPATFPDICNGLSFRSIGLLRMCVQNLKFVALPVPGIIGSTQKIWAVPGYAHAPFSPKFFMGLCSDGPCECIGQIYSPYSFSRSWDNSDCSFGVGLWTPNLGEGKAVGGRGWHLSKERWWVPIGTP